MSAPTHNWDRWRLEMPSEYCEWIYRLIRRENPKEVFEIGLGPGASSVATLLAIGDAGTNAPLVTVDINPRYERVERVEEICRAKHRWHVECSDSAKYAELLASKKQKFDYIYIDGGHEASIVYEDAMACYDILALNGIMVFDDCGTKEYGAKVNTGISEFVRYHKDMKEEFPDLDVINPHGARVFRKMP